MYDGRIKEENCRHYKRKPRVRGGVPCSGPSPGQRRLPGPQGREEENRVKTVQIKIIAEYEFDLSKDDLNDIEKIITEIWPNARSLHTESNTCKDFETEIELKFIE